MPIHYFDLIAELLDILTSVVMIGSLLVILAEGTFSTRWSCRHDVATSQHGANRRPPANISDLHHRHMRPKDKALMECLGDSAVGDASSDGAFSPGPLLFQHANTGRHRPAAALSSTPITTNCSSTIAGCRRVAHPPRYVYSLSSPTQIPRAPSETPPVPSQKPGLGLTYSVKGNRFSLLRPKLNTSEFGSERAILDLSESNPAVETTALVNAPLSSNYQHSDVV